MQSGEVGQGPTHPSASLVSSHLLVPFVIQSVLTGSEMNRTQIPALGVEAGGGDLEGDRAEQIWESLPETDGAQAEA